MPWASASGEPAPPRRQPGARWRGSALRAAAACALLLGLFWGLSRVEAPPGGEPRLGGQRLAPSPAPGFAGLLDTRGRAFDWNTRRDGAVVVVFGYTHCPDVCPLTLERLARVLGELGPGARSVQVVFVTLDPARDTPQVLRAYLDALLPGAIGLRGNAADTAAAAARWGVHWRVAREPGAAPDDADYWLDHTAAVSLVGPRGQLLARYGYAQLMSRGLLLHDLRQLLGSPASGGAAA